MRRVLFGSLAGLGVLALASMAAALMGGVADTDTTVAMVCVDDSDCPVGQFCVDPGHCVPYGLVCVDDEDCFVGECCINMYCVPCPEACCYPDNSCMEYVPAACTSDGGSPQGSGTNCATVDCAAAAEEACCFPGGTCADVDPATCSTQGGSPQGSGTNCATVDCAAVQFCTTDADCDDGNECTDDWCDLITMTCINNPEPNGTWCEADGDYCTLDECQGGTCVPGAPIPGCCDDDLDCDDGNECTDDWCDLITMTCINNPEPDGTWCEADGDYCTLDECQDGSCVPGAPIPGCCDDDADCPDDGDVCNGPEMCDLATMTCFSGLPLDCDDGDACTTDSCDQITGCENVPAAEVCDDGLDNDCDGLTDGDDPDCGVPPEELTIDIKPGSYPNSINPEKSRGVIPVAILTTEDFGAVTVDPETVVFAGASPVRWAVEDVDYDGDYDLILHFRTQETDIVPGDIEACVTGQTFDSMPIQGCDSLRTVPGA